jgi:competence protein ComEC
VGWAVAVWLGLLAGPSLGILGAGLGLALAPCLAALSLRAPDRVGTLALLLAVLAASAARGAGHHLRYERAAETVGAESRVSWIRARIVEHPWREAGEPIAVLRVEDAADIRAGARVRLRLPPGTAAEWGDRIEVLARLERPPLRRSPGGYSARDGARAQGIVFQGRALYVRGVRREDSSLPRATVARWRRALEEVFARRLSGSTREIVTPLVTGDRSGLGPELNAQLQAAGLTHLLALSGLHLVWMAAVARGMAALLGLGVGARAWAGAGCALLYVGIAGPLPSLMRAAATETLSAAALLRGRALDPMQALALGAAGLLAIAPGWAGDLGFQLSCAATLGLITVGGRLTSWSFSWPRAVAWVARAAFPTAAAQMTSLPLLLASFHCLPWTALAANLMAIPVCELLLVSAWLGAAVEWAAPGSGRWAFAACEILGGAMRVVAGWAASAPLALAPTGSSPWLPALAGVGAVLVVLALSGPRSLRPETWKAAACRAATRHLGLFALTLAMALAISAPTLLPAPGRWWVVVLDVGQGDAIALGFPDGWWLVDAGPRTPRFDAGAGVVLPFLRWAAVRRLETLVLTHEHGDHVGGAPAVRRALRIDRVVVPEGATDASGAERVAGGDTLRSRPEVLVRWPPRGFRSSDKNFGSLVLEVMDGDMRACLAADVDSLVETTFAARPLALLKVAHHGAASSSGSRFLGRARPREAVISCGRSNPFGHPDTATVRRLQQSGARVHRTDRGGTVWIELTPAGARVLDWRAGRFTPRLPSSPAPSAGGTLAASPARW